MTIAASHPSAAQGTTKASAPDQSVEKSELRFVAIVSRHGVRSPTGRAEQLNQYSAQPWPDWKLPAGYLTEHGFQLMTLMGAWDRQMLLSQGLFHGSGCEDARHIRILADSDQRTRETGRALAKGLAPDCAIEVQALAEGTPDPLFHSVEAGVGSPDRGLAVAALNGRIGGSAEALVQAYRPQLTQLQQVLDSCASGASCASEKQIRLMEIPAVVSPGKSDHIAELRTPLSVASTITENFLLEYCNGMDAQQVAWGKVNADSLRALLQLHVAQEDYAGRTEAIARPQASNLLAHLLSSMRQAADGKPMRGALSRPDDRLLVLAGHDTNLVNIAGALHLNWVIDGRKDDTPPGGALVFELWKMPGKDSWQVRTWYVAQTLEQMRMATPLTANEPPQRVPVFLPGCGRADGSCSLDGFRRAIEASIDPAYVKE